LSDGPRPGNGSPGPGGRQTTELSAARPAAASEGGPEQRWHYITRLSHAFTNATSVDGILRLAVEQAAELLSAEAAVLMLTDADGLLRVRASIGVSDVVVERFRQSFDESLVTRLQGLFGAGAPDRFIGVPLVVHGRVTGLLAVMRPIGESRTADDEALLSALADQTAAPLEHARLAERVERTALAADNARLFEAEQAARIAADRARADAEAANRAKTEFLHNMSHELRTPLNAISGYIDLIALGVHGPVSDEIRQDLERIRAGQLALLRIVEDVLDVAKAETGRVELEMSDVALHELLSGAEVLVLPQLFAKSLNYQYTAGDPMVRVRADRQRLHQIITNLLANAIKFTAPGGTISLSSEARTDAVLVRVTDTGCGIPADKLEEIFEPFVRIDNALARTTQGAGLGLTISRALARGMGGELTVESALGRGSTFILRLPVAV